MNILITGIAGFIGSHLAERLLQDGHQVRGIDRFSNYYSVKLKQANAQVLREKGATIFEKDLTVDNLEEIFEGTDVVCHLAAQPGISKLVSFQEYIMHTIIATERVVEASQKAGVKFIVNISTSSVYGAQAIGDESSEPMPVSYYGVTKLAAEQLVLSRIRKNQINGCSLRPFSVIGERERPEKLIPQVILNLLADKPFEFYEGSNEHVRSFTYVGDIVQGSVAVLSHLESCNGQIINLGNEKTHTTEDVIAILEKLLDKKISPTIKPSREGDQKETRAEIGKARKLLSFNPATSLEEALKREVAWFKDNYHLYV